MTPSAAGDAETTTARIAASHALGPRARLLSIVSPAVGSVSVRLLLPARFERRPDARWPVLYLLHGMWDDSSAWMRETRVEALTAELDLLVVMPDGGRFGFYTDWWNYGQGGRPMWETFHLTELPAMLGQDFRADDRRVVAGLSMGGFGAMKYAARHAGMFRAAASFSGVLDILGVARVPPQIDPQAFGDREAQGEMIRQHDPLTMADGLRGLPLYVSWGDGTPGPLDGPDAAEDPDEAWIGQGNERFVERLGVLGIPVTARGGAGTHTWPYWERGLAEALPLLLDALEG